LDLLNENITREIRKDNCFDFLRFFFATILIISHFCILTGNNQLLPLDGGTAVKAFFSITGFLVTYSFLRRDYDIISYAKKRFARIIPAYIVTIFFCVFIGWVVTSLSTKDYFFSVQTWKYFITNIFMLNWLEPELPNTFQTNPLPQMDGSLWVMKQEVIFYILIPLLVFFAKKIGKEWVCIPLTILCFFIYPYVNIQTKLFTYFIGGMTLMLFFDIYNKYLKYIFCISLCALLFEVCETIAFPMMLVGIAYHCKPLNLFKKVDNITYGLFLYHFPVIQALIHYGIADYSLTLCFILTFIITSFLATISWFCIEKPLMNRCA
jgi:peptidoglycan/LPS O-acetylase OafA/YrhL